MNIYLVGGAIRDALLGLVVKDRDWVVVGGTLQTMLDKGYLPIGKDFPVLLDPKLHEEYALARTERKTAKGYHGFSFYADEDVTLEQDLSRRDLTVNAMAIKVEHLGTQNPSGELPEHGALPFHTRIILASSQVIDPYYGQRDIRQKVLRHVTLAFREDPVRILRVARFSARFIDFTIAPETMTLMRGMVAKGETASLVAERVWQEISKGLMEEKPSLMFAVLQDCGLLAKLLPTWSQYTTAMLALDVAASKNYPLSVRYATLQLPHGSLKAPNDCQQLAQVVSKFLICYKSEADALEMYECLERSDAIRQPDRFALALKAVECLQPDIATLPIENALQALMSVACESISQQSLLNGLTGSQIGALIAEARIKAIAQTIP